MSENLFLNIVWAWMILAFASFLLLQQVVAPFGRHTRSGFGPLINNIAAWSLMESVSLFTFSFFFLSGSAPKTYQTCFFFILWLLHYINRAFIYPYRQKNKRKKMPDLIFILAIGFNSMNGFVNGYYLGNYTDGYGWNWISDPRFIGGIVLFFAGMYINMKSDNMLLALRKPGESDYKIPNGFLFKYISCPNHFGEIIEWTGFALMTWNLAGLSFAIWTFANLAPRAVAHHQWYYRHFTQYPKNRKALIPYIL